MKIIKIPFPLYKINSDVYNLLSMEKKNDNKRNTITEQKSGAVMYEF